MRDTCVVALLLGAGLLGAVRAPAAEPARPAFRSHPPVRPLPVPSDRPANGGPGYFVSPSGKDSNDGSEKSPWKTLNHALARLKPGDTLSLRGGTYHEHATVTLSGTADRPITLRSYPGELAILDGGFREFLESPKTAWEPAPAGAKGEFRSTKGYPDVGSRGGSERRATAWARGPDGPRGGFRSTKGHPHLGRGRRGVPVLGTFADSMAPLHGYPFLRAYPPDKTYWNLENKLETSPGV